MTDGEAGAGEADRTIRVRAPDTDELLGEVPAHGPEEVGDLVRRARSAAPAWRELSLERRAERIRQLRDRIVERMDELAEVVAGETGKTLLDVYLAEIHPACDHLAYAAERAPEVLGERRMRSLGAGTHRGRIRYEPYGVAGVITPWNFPFAITAGAAGSALVAGNAVVLKPSELTPFTSLALKGLADEVLPDPDLLLVATGDGATGRAVVDAPVDVVSFTGSVATGRKVMETAARHLTPVILELGGKDAMIVLDDADLERAARGAVWGGFFHAGQICQSVERVLVQEPVHDRFLALVVEETERLRTGPRREGPDLGALTRPDQLEVVEEHVAEARERGARVHTGGRRREGPGTFYEPTVLSGVTPEMRIWRDETFGPVLPVTSFRRDDDAVELANDTRYGLDAYVWTGNRRRGRRLADRLRAGSVMLNDCITNYALPELPFGGVGESGFGRTHGEEGLRAFARPRSEAEPRLKLSREPHWFPGAHRASWARAVIRLLHGDGVRDRLSGVWAALRGRDARRGRAGRDGDGGTLPEEARSTAVGARRRGGDPGHPGDGSDATEDDRDAGGDG